MNSFRQRIRNLANDIFSFRDIDGHYKLNLLGMRMSVSHKMKVKWPSITEIGINRDEVRSPRIIASLTSIPKRIPTLYNVLATLLNQSCKPDVLVLWLSYEEFPKKEADLPREILDIQKYGLTIKWCKNIKSYKKLVPSLMEYPNDIIITFDDDIFYAPNVISDLYASYKRYPDAVHCYRAGRISVTEARAIVPMHNKELMYLDFSRPSYLNVVMSGTGTLFPPKSLYKDILDENVFMKLLPTNDEIFFWAMCVLNNTRIVNVKNFNYDMYCIKSAQKYALSRINQPGSPIGMDGKSALQFIYRQYPQIYDKIKSEPNEI